MRLVNRLRPVWIGAIAVVSNVAVAVKSNESSATTTLSCWDRSCRWRPLLALAEVTPAPPGLYGRQRTIARVVGLVVVGVVGVDGESVDVGSGVVEASAVGRHWYGELDCVGEHRRPERVAERRVPGVPPRVAADRRRGDCSTRPTTRRYAGDTRALGNVLSANDRRGAAPDSSRTKDSCGRITATR